MTYIIQLDSNTFPGKKCYFVSLAGTKWLRTTAKKEASFFKTKEEAQNAIAKVREEIAYTAPEANGNLDNRLKEAKIIKVNHTP